MDLLENFKACIQKHTEFWNIANLGKVQMFLHQILMIWVADIFWKISAPSRALGFINGYVLFREIQTLNDEFRWDRKGKILNSLKSLCRPIYCNYNWNTEFVSSSDLSLVITSLKTGLWRNFRFEKYSFLGGFWMISGSMNKTKTYFIISYFISSSHMCSKRKKKSLLNYDIAAYTC
jgi:hypothetical protein